MKKLAFITLSTLMVSTAAFADDGSALCHLVGAKQAAMNSNAAYQPGVDAAGKPVVAADLAAPAANGLPDVIRIPLDVDMAARFGAGLPAGTEMKAGMGLIEFHQSTGKVTLNGQDVTAMTATVCASTPQTEESSTPAKHADKTDAAPKAPKHHHTAAAAQNTGAAGGEKTPDAPTTAEAPVTQEAVPPAAAMPSSPPAMAAPTPQAAIPAAPPVSQVQIPAAPQPPAIPPATPPAKTGVPSAPPALDSGAPDLTAPPPSLQK